MSSLRSSLTDNKIIRWLRIILKGLAAGAVMLVFWLAIPWIDLHAPRSFIAGWVMFPLFPLLFLICSVFLLSRNKYDKWVISLFIALLIFVFFGILICNELARRFDGGYAVFPSILHPLYLFGFVPVGLVTGLLSSIDSKEAAKDGDPNDADREVSRDEPSSPTFIWRGLAAGLIIIAFWIWISTGIIFYCVLGGIVVVIVVFCLICLGNNKRIGWSMLIAALLWIVCFGFFHVFGPGTVLQGQPEEEIKYVLQNMDIYSYLLFWGTVILLLIRWVFRKWKKSRE